MRRMRISLYDTSCNFMGGMSKFCRGNGVLGWCEVRGEGGGGGRRIVAHAASFIKAHYKDRSWLFIRVNTGRS